MNVTRMMDGRVVGIDVARRLGLAIAPAEAQRYATVPFSDTELKDASQRGLYLVAMPAVALLQLPRINYGFPWDPDWYRKEAFPSLKARAGYHLLGQLQNSENKGWDEQVSMLPPGYSVPFTVEIAYLVLAWVALYDKRAFSNTLRCADSFQNTTWHMHVYAFRTVMLDSGLDEYPSPETSIAVGRYRSLL